MITFTQAKQIAKETDPKLNAYTETPDAYIFTNSKATKDEQWDNELVILKASGKTVSYFEYSMNSKHADKVSEQKEI